MNRDNVREEILRITNKSVLIELPTGFGKSLVGMDLCLRDSPNTILIVVPRIVLIENWRNEFIKWGNKDYLNKVTFSTYAGLHKIKGNFDCIILDEAHHITERVQELLSDIKYKRAILLSATVKKALKRDLHSTFPDLYTYKVSMKEAIDNDVLPDPIVYLLPLTLDRMVVNQEIVKHPKASTPIFCAYRDRWNYLKNKNYRVIIKCTQYQKNCDFDSEIEYWKKKYMISNNMAIKNKWLHLAGQRLKWLSSLKNKVVLELLDKFKNERVLTFCNSIEQTEELGKNCINSKNKDAINILGAFNDNKINHITACNMLNEGMNLINCRIGIYANLNSSEIIVKQRLGRILRHKNPIIVIPFYKNTREEELVREMIKDYNTKLIHVINNINEIII